MLSVDHSLMRRLLFHRVRPIFVFDGATPPSEAQDDHRQAQVSNSAPLNPVALPAQLLVRCLERLLILAGLPADTVIKCCRRREQQTAKLRKTAEKLLMAQLKKHALQVDTSLKVVVFPHGALHALLCTPNHSGSEVLVGPWWLNPGESSGP